MMTQRNGGRGLAPLGEMPEEGGGLERVIVCSNVLPVRLKKDPGSGWSAEFELDCLFEDGPMYTSLKGLEGHEVLYVGVPGVFVPVHERDVVENVLAKVGCYPVWCDAKRAHNHFQGYCKGILWPTFHNVIDLYSAHVPQEMLGLNKSEDDSENAIPVPRSKSGDSKEGDWEKSRSWNPMEAENCWPDYCATNGMFARKVVEIYNPGDLVWVHDYHLLLMPNYILRKLPNACCGLFVHVPFPSSEIFRTLAAREEILRAMLCADHIGFDLYEYARHFLTCCQRMLGLSHGSKRGGVLYVDNQGRDVSITCTHVGLNTQLVEARLAESATQKLAQQMALEFGQGGGDRGHSKMVLVSVDEVEGLRGLSLKLLALDRLFTDYSHLRGRVVMRQIGLILDSRPDDYRQCHDEVLGLVKLLKAKWGADVLQYEEFTSYGLAERLALFQNGDVYLCTAVRKGMDMVPFEYLMARRSNAGCIVMSEFTAASRVLHGSLRVNPFKTGAVAATIEEALTMSLSERTARASRDLAFVEGNTLHQWAEHLLADIRAAHKEADAPVTQFGGGFGTRIVTMADQDKQEDLITADPPFLEAYKAASRRLLLLDYSGTLVETSPINLYLKKGGEARTWHYTNGGSRRPGGCLETRDPISDTARTALIDLCRDPANTVVVLSADLRDELHHALEGIPNLVLVAENGFVFRVPVPDAEWVNAIDNGKPERPESRQSRHLSSADSEVSSEVVSEPEALLGGEMQSWQERTNSAMTSYADRTNGAFVWQSPAAVSFNYILADPDLGCKQAKNLAIELDMLLANMPLTVDQGKGFVTVRMRGVNRGTAIREIIGRLATDATEPTFDFIACFGDDNEDEPSFATTNKYARRFKDNSVISYSVRVGGDSKSKARYKVHDPAEVIEVLGNMVEASQSKSKVRRNFSLGDFNRGSDGQSGGLGSFKTKQSYVALNSQADKEEQLSHNPQRTLSSVNLQAAAAAGPIAGGMSNRPNPNTVKHSPSYVASADEMAELFGTMPDPSLIPEATQDLPSNDAAEMFDPDPRGIPPTASDLKMKNLDTTFDHESEDGGEGDIYFASVSPRNSAKVATTNIPASPEPPKTDPNAELLKLTLAAVGGGLFATILVIALVKR